MAKKVKTGAALAPARVALADGVHSVSAMCSGRTALGRFGKHKVTAFYVEDCRTDAGQQIGDAWGLDYDHDRDNAQSWADASFSGTGTRERFALIVRSGEVVALAPANSAGGFDWEDYADIYTQIDALEPVAAKRARFLAARRVWMEGNADDYDTRRAAHEEFEGLADDDFINELLEGAGAEDIDAGDDE